MLLTMSLSNICAMSPQNKPITSIFIIISLYLFSVNSFIPIFAILFSIFIIQFYKLPPPHPDNVISVFGPLHTKSISKKRSITEESTCQCHYYETERSDPTKNLNLFSAVPQESKCSHSKRKRLVPSMKPPERDLSFSIIGHRGAGMDAPENSLAAIKKCASMGCTMVEFDVTLTKDLVPVLVHDDNLLRVMGVDRRVSEITWGDLRKIDISDEFPGDTVPTLEEAVETCLALGVRFIIDIKEENEKLVDSIVDIFQRYGNQAYSSGVISSFYFRVIYRIRAKDPNIVGCMAWRPSHFALPWLISRNYSPYFQSMEAITSKIIGSIIYGTNDFAMNYLYWWLLGLSAVLVHKDALNIERVAKLRRKGLRVYAWTVNCPVEKQYFINKLKIGYLTDTLLDTESEDCLSCSPAVSMPSPESWLCNNNY